MKNNSLYLQGIIVLKNLDLKINVKNLKDLENNIDVAHVLTFSVT